MQGDTKGIKDFIAVLMLYGHYKADEVEAAVELALEKNLCGSDGVRHLLIYTNKKGTGSTPLTDWPSMPSPDVTVYGVLGGVQ
jgi:hypothetical protein